MPLVSNYPKTCTQTQGDEKEARVRGRKCMERREKLARKTLKRGGLAAETKLRREEGIGPKNEGEKGKGNKGG